MLSKEQRPRDNQGRETFSRMDPSVHLVDLGKAYLLDTVKQELNTVFCHDHQNGDFLISGVFNFAQLGALDDILSEENMAALTEPEKGIIRNAQLQQFAKTESAERDYHRKAFQKIKAALAPDLFTRAWLSWAVLPCQSPIRLSIS